MAKVSAENFQSEPPVLVDFYSESCIPCKIMSPLLAGLDEEYGGRFKLAKDNVSFNAELAQEHQVFSAP